MKNWKYEYNIYYLKTYRLFHVLKHPCPIFAKSKYDRIFDRV